MRLLLVLLALAAGAGSADAASSVLIEPPAGYELVQVGLSDHKVTNATYRDRMAYLVETPAPRTFGVTFRDAEGNEEVARYRTLDDLNALHA